MWVDQIRFSRAKVQLGWKQVDSAFIGDATFLGKNVDYLVGQESNIELSLAPLTDWHLIIFNGDNLTHVCRTQ